MTGSIPLNKGFTFETYVTGKSNQIAFNEAKRTADADQPLANPLFLFGPTGLGKTHLMHAIGHYIQARNRHLNLLYISADRFINEMINAIRFDRLPAFRQKLIDTGVATEAQLAEMQAKIEAEVEDAIEFGMNSEFPDVAELRRDVFAEEIPA